MLTALPEQLIVTDAAREQRPSTLVEREDDEWEPPPPDDRGGRPRAEPDGDQSDDQTALATLTAPVQALAQGTEPSGIDWTRAAEDVRALRGGIATLQVDGQQREEAEGWLTLASVRVAARSPLPADDATALAAELLLAAATDPRPDGEDDLARFDQFPSWGFPAGRVDAARGLIALAREPDRLPDGALRALQTLAGDRAAAVRLRVAEHLGVLASTQADLAWQFADQLAGDPSAAVRQTLLGSFARLAADDRDRALELVVRVSREEATRAAPHEGLLTAATHLLIECWVWQGAPQGRTLLEQIVGDLGAYAEIAPRLTFALRNPTTYGEVGAADPNADAVRARAIGAFTSLARAGLAAFHAELDAYQATVAAGGTVDEKQLKAAGNLVDHACTELYFASGAYQSSGNGEQPRVSEAQRERFYNEAPELIDTLCDAPLPRAAHHVMQTLERSIELDPRGVLLRTGRVLQAAHTWHYAHDQMALALFINITQRYLAEHREPPHRRRMPRESAAVARVLCRRRVAGREATRLPARRGVPLTRIGAAALLGAPDRPGRRLIHSVERVRFVQHRPDRISLRRRVLETHAYSMRSGLHDVFDDPQPIGPSEDRDVRLIIGRLRWQVHHLCALALVGEVRQYEVEGTVRNPVVHRKCNVKP